MDEKFLDEKFLEAAVKLKDCYTSHPLKFDPKNGSHSRHFELSQEIQSWGYKEATISDLICLHHQRDFEEDTLKLQAKPTLAI